MFRRTKKDISIAVKITYIIIGIIVIYGGHLRYQTLAKTVVDHPTRADAGDYYNYASNIAKNHIYSRQNPQLSSNEIKPDALRSPGFPVFASLFINTDLELSVSRTLLAQTLIQVLVFLILTIALVKWLGAYWSLAPIAIIWTFPHFITINAFYLSESIFTSGLVLFIVMFAEHCKDGFPPAKTVWVSGLLLGSLALIRPVTEYLPWFIALIAIIEKRENVKSASIFLLSAILPIGLWKIRNYIVINSFGDPTLTINALYHGSFPGFMYNGEPKTLGFPYRYDPDSARIYEGIPTALAIIVEKIKDAPKEYLKWYLVGKQMFLWRWSLVAGYGDIFIYPILNTPYQHLSDMYNSYLLNKSAHPIWLAIGLLTCITTVGRVLLSKVTIHPAARITAVVIVYAILIHIIIAPYPRYGIPFKTAIIVAAFFGLKEFSAWLKLSMTQK